MSDSFQVHQLRCEYFANPLAIDVDRPRLSWVLRDDRRGARQTAYHVLVASSPEKVNRNVGDLWDSGKVASDQSVHVAYAGKPLLSRQQAFWKVQAWDGQDKPSGWSEPALWEMGPLHRDDWKAQWIGSTTVGGPRTMAPVPYLRKAFELSSKPVARARLYVTAMGLYEFEINGQRVGDAIFAPGRTEYTRRVPYHVFDVAPLLKAGGANACGAILGDGWYCGFLHSDPRQTYGDRPRLLAQLEIDFADGSSQTIATDGSWKTTSHGPIRSSDLLMGEDYDARMELGAWSVVGFDDANWEPVKLFDDPGIAIVAARAPVVRKHEEIKPVAEPSNAVNRRRWIFDLGQNMVGRVRLKVSGPRGTTVAIRHAEMLDKDGKPYTQALRSARATDYYTLKGKGEEIYEPRFTFHGFRYVELHGLPTPPTIDSITGVVLHSDTPPTGSFECSDSMINQLQHNIVWSQKGNFLDIPTDCPQRDERLGWTGDAQVFIRTASFNMDVANFFTKWLTDMADSQGDDGRIPSVVPHVVSIFHEGGPAWADAAVICPWTLYLCYGDKRILEESWPMMSLFLKYLQENCRNYIRADEHWKWKGYGDWLSINAHTPPDLIGTAFYAWCAALMSQAAAVLGRNDDAAKYHGLFEKVRDAWLKRYIEDDGSAIKVRTQTACVLALHFDLLPEKLRAGVFKTLVHDIEERGMHLSTGFVGTPYLNPVLTRFGRADIAFALLKQTTFPSWLFPVTHGATTMWERWDGWTPEHGFNDAGMNSYNHYAYGAVGEWLYSIVCGIDLDPRKPGYRHIIIHPHVGGGLTYAKASLNSIHGPIASALATRWQEVRAEHLRPRKHNRHALHARQRPQQHHREWETHLRRHRRREVPRQRWCSRELRAGLGQLPLRIAHLAHRPDMSIAIWKRNWDQTRQHFEDWWDHTGLVLGAWGTGLPGPKAHADVPQPPDVTDPFIKHTDATLIARCTRHKMANRVWPADILPAAWPHIGTLPLATYLGATPEYAANNVWYRPCMSDLESHPPLQFDPSHPEVVQLETIVRESVESSQGNYLIGMPAILGGIDILAELRGTADMLMEMIENPDAVHRRLREIQAAYVPAFDRMYDLIKQPDSAMAFGYFMLYGRGKVGLCQCDTASMFSPAMFDEFVIPYLREQCAFLDRSMFHIDGSQCLAHLDLLLGIDDLDAIEYTPDPKVPNGGSAHWFDLYKKILAAGKSLWVANLKKDEVLPVLDSIGGKGVYLSVNGLSADDAEGLARNIEAYR